jgi:multidrug efflux pump subunit AcrB
MELPVQTSLSQTQRVVAAVQEQILAQPTVKTVSWFLGETAPSFYYNVIGSRENQSNYAQGLVELQAKTLPQPVIHALQDQLDQAFPQAQILVRQLEQGPPFEAPVEVRVYGPDLNQLRRLGNELRRILAQVPQVEHSRATLGEALPKLGLRLNESEIRLTGLDRQTLAQQLNNTLEGAIGGSVLEATEELPVRVRLVNRDRGDLAQVGAVDLLSGQGENVPLAALGQVELLPDTAVIARRQGQRVNTVQGFITAGELPAQVLGNFREALTSSDFQLPPGYRLEYGGETEAQGTALGNLFSTVGVLVVLMVAVLVLSLESFWLAAVIGIIGVSALGLALAALKIFNYPFGFMAILGSLGLMGLSINDSIVVLVALKADTAAQTGRSPAIVQVVMQATRHVITTTVTTIAGFIPLLFDTSGFWPPLAIAIAGGLGGATLLALFFVPSVYLILVRQGWLKPQPSIGTHKQ